MNIELSASFQIGDEDLSKFGDLKKDFRITHWPNQSTISIELIECRLSQGVEPAVCDFISTMSVYGRFVKGYKCLLRVAVYFSNEEALAFSVALSLGTIQLLFEHGMDIEVTGYPCAD